MGVIQCAKMQFQAKIYVKIAAILKNFLQCVQKIVICKFCYKSGIKGVIGVDRRKKEKESLGVRLAQKSGLMTDSHYPPRNWSAPPPPPRS